MMMGGKGRQREGRRPHKKVVRQKLLGIESYGREVELTVKEPARVVVRLERLMGSSRIRITDNYLSTFAERLIADEGRSWVFRNMLRKKVEKIRSRQLVINGLMEPAEDMEKLKRHPVFRVNRVLQRLDAFDTQMAIPGADERVPPIQPVEPFADDPSGAVFKEYPGHNTFVFVDELGEYISQVEEFPQSADSSLPVSSASAAESSEDDDGDDDMEEEEDPLDVFKTLYGVPPTEDLVKNWQPYTSPLVRKAGAEIVWPIKWPIPYWLLYQAGNDVIDMYARREATVTDFVQPLEADVVRRLKSGAISMASQSKVEIVEEGEEGPGRTPGGNEDPETEGR